MFISTFVKYVDNVKDIKLFVAMFERFSSKTNFESGLKRPQWKLLRDWQWVVVSTTNRPSIQFIENNARAPVGHRRGQEGAVVRARGAGGGGR